MMQGPSIPFTSTSSKASCAAVARAASSFVRMCHGSPCRFCPSPPTRTPPSNSKCLHRGDFSSAPPTIALTHPSRSSSLGVPYGLLSCSCSSFCITAMVAVLKTLRILRQSSKLIGWSHNAGAVRSCDARRLMFNGLPRTDKKLVAVGRRLVFTLVDNNSGRGSRV